MNSYGVICSALAALFATGLVPLDKNLVRLGAAPSLLPHAQGPFLPLDGATEEQCAPGTCQIELRRVTSLTGSASEVVELPTMQVLVARDARGRFATLNRQSDRLVIFDQDGRYQTTIGRRGRGAGEFERIVGLYASPSREFLLYDVILRSLTVLKPDLTFGDRTPFPYRPSLLRADGSFLVAAQIRTPELVGYPLHLVESTGRVVRSFGVDTPEYRADLTRLTSRHVAVAESGGIWAAAPGRYVLERWDPDTGTRLQSLHVKSSWFRESDRPEGPSERPASIINAIWERNGYLWVLLQDADSRWRPDPDPSVERPFDGAVYNSKLDWVIEALNPSTGEVVASRRFDEVLYQRSPDSLLTSVTFAPSGAVAEIGVWTADLQRTARQ